MSAKELVEYVAKSLVDDPDAVHWVRILPPLPDREATGWRYFFRRELRAQLEAEALPMPGRMMHAKCGVIDGVWSTIGSYNFDAQSRFNNLEVSVEIIEASLLALSDEDLRAQVRVIDHHLANAMPPQEEQIPDDHRRAGHRKERFRRHVGEGP